MNKAMYHRRNNSLWVSHQLLDAVSGIYDALKLSLNPDTLHLCARFLLTKAALFLEDSAAFANSIQYFTDGLKHLVKEHKIRSTSQSVFIRIRREPKVLFKIRRCVIVEDEINNIIDTNNCADDIQHRIHSSLSSIHPYAIHLIFQIVL